MDQLVREGIVDLGAQALDRHVDDVGVAVEVHVPDLRGDQGARQYLALAAHQQVQEGELLVGQGDHLPLAADLAPQHVQLQIGQLHLLCLADHAAAQQGTDTQQQLGEGEGFHQVVVGTQFEAADTVLQLVAGGEEEHRHIVLLAQHFHDLPTVQAGQHHVEDHQVVAVLQRQVETVGAVLRPVDRITRLAEALLQVLAGLRIVFDHQDAHVSFPSFAAILASARRGFGDIFVMRKSSPGTAGGATIEAQPHRGSTDASTQGFPALFFGLLLASAASFAAQPPAGMLQPLRGTIQQAADDHLQLKARNGQQLTVRLTDKTAIRAVSLAKPEDIQPDSFIGTAAVPQPDGTLKALEVHVFAPACAAAAKATGPGRTPMAAPRP